MTSKTPPKNYFSRKYDQSNPGLILFLVDQSLSMNQEVEGHSKAAIAAKAINQTIESLIERCRRRGEVADKAVVGVIGYGEKTEFELMGDLSELDESFSRIEIETVAQKNGPDLSVERKIWLEPRFANTTPMAEAMDMATARLSTWVQEYPDTPPPVVLNVTDGIPNDLQRDGKGNQTRTSAEKLRKLGESFEQCLLLCVHIASDSSAPSLFPADRSEMKDSYQELLFDISSTLPAEMLRLAKLKGLPAQAESKLLTINASAGDLLRVLDFGSSRLLAATDPKEG